jgi:hypothetical protein
MNRRFGIALFASLALIGETSAQTIWYVDAMAAGPGNGTASTPYRTIKYALQQANVVAGDTLLVGPGSYPAAFSTNKMVAIRSVGGPERTTIGPNLAQYAVSISTPSLNPGTVLEGFTVYGAVRGNDATIRRCIVVGPGSVGLAAIDFIEADHCTVVGFAVGAAGIVHGGTVHAHNTIVYGNDFDVSEGYPDYTWWETDYVFGTSGLGPPGFFDQDGHDFHLLANSPCRDTGDPASPLDPDGTRTDMGALTFDPSYAPFTVYCTAKTNSQGCVPAISATHSASLSSGPFWIECTQELNQKLGFLFYGFAGQNTPYQGGYLCVQPPTKRTLVQNSGGNVGPDDCSGTFAFEFNALLQSGSDPALDLGAEVYCQYWSRDPTSSSFSNRSDALHFTIQI